MNIESPSTHKPYRLLFDRECPYCCRFAGMVRQFDQGRFIETLSLQEHYESDTSIPLDQLTARVHLLGPEGAVYMGGEAVQKIISLVPQVKAIRWMIESRWGRKGADFLYGALSRFRRCTDCGRR